MGNYEAESTIVKLYLNDIKRLLIYTLKEEKYTGSYDFISKRIHIQNSLSDPIYSVYTDRD